MGCSNGKLKDTSSVESYPDARVPLTREEILHIQDMWSSIKQKFEDTAKDNLMRFFHQYPYFQQLFPKLKDLKSAADMRHNMAFEIQAMAIFDIFDEIVINLEKDVDRIFLKFEEVVRIHSHFDGFSGDLFQYMEESFLESVRYRCNRKFQEHDQALFRKLYKWIADTLLSMFVNNSFETMDDAD